MSFDVLVELILEKAEDFLFMGDLLAVFYV